MRNLRIIPRLDIKSGTLIKGVQMEGWRKVGDPILAAKRYSEYGADELLFMDVVASLYERNTLHEIVEQVCSNVFIPVTVGGGIRKIKDVETLLSRGADKVSVNTGALLKPELINEISDRYGSQATVLTVECLKCGEKSWEALTDNGRNRSGREVIEWVKEAENRGAGEIVLTSIDQDGRGYGFDIDLVDIVSQAVNIPIIASGGFGKPSHIVELIKSTDVSGAAIAQALHWEKVSFSEIRDSLRDNNVFLRDIEE